MATVEAQAPPKIRPPKGRSRRRMQFILLGLGIAFLLALWGTGFTPWNVFGRLEAIGGLIDRLIPPTFSEWPRYLQAVGETLLMVLAGTCISLVLAVPISALAARNITTGPVAYNIARFIITLTRAVPSLVLALLFVRAIGVGPTAGVLAMGISSVGMIGKFFADRIEEIDMGIVEASRASGATRLQTFVAAVLPQIITNWISLSLYRFDINLRNAVILGFVGAGGIGFELQRVLGQLVYQRVLAIAIIIFVMILLIEQLSALTRSAILGSESLSRNNPFTWRAQARRNRERALATTATERVAVQAARSRVEDPRRSGKIRVGWGDGRRLRWSLAWGAVLAVVVSFSMLGLGPVQVGEAAARIIPFVGDMFPPDFVSNIVRHLELMLETIWMALAATVLGLVLALPVGILAAKNSSVHPVVSRIARILTVVVRGIPDLMLAILLVVAVGLGPLAGVLALTVGAVGFTGKLIADAVEDTDLSGQTEAMRSVGAGWWQRTFTSTLPTALPAIVGTAFFTFDTYVRSATIMGVVGAGGIGLALDASIRGRSLGQTLALILMILVMVYLIERLSAWMRKQLI